LNVVVLHGVEGRHHGALGGLVIKVRQIVVRLSERGLVRILRYGAQQSELRLAIRREVSDLNQCGG